MKRCLETIGEVPRAWICMKDNSYRFIGVLVTMLLITSATQAMPFNQDMATGQNIPAGQMMRGKAVGSVAVGASSRYQGSRDEALTLKNPIASTVQSVEHGKRLYNVNCTPCHGSYENGQYLPGGVQDKVPGPDLNADYIKVKPDGHFFSFVHFGGMAIMPAYGYKLSTVEHWDIVNYIRHFQQGSK